MQAIILMSGPGKVVLNNYEIQFKKIFFQKNSLLQ